MTKAQIAVVNKYMEEIEGHLDNGITTMHTDMDGNININKGRLSEDMRSNFYKASDLLIELTGILHEWSVGLDEYGRQI